MRYEEIPTLQIWQRDSAVLASGSSSRVSAIRNAWGTPQAKVQAATIPGLNSGARPADLVQIDSDLTTYYKAFSPMAKVNVLNDLRRAIDAWQQAHPGPLPPAMGALKEVVDRKLNLRPSGSRYNQAICIAYHTGCNYEHSTGTTHVGPDARLRNTDYFRHSDDDSIDMDTKCRNLWAGIDAAKNGITLAGLADSNRTLKIFMAPEFYFRGKNGAYSPDIVSSIIPRMRSLGTGKNTYDDWLFIFGTAVASIELSLDYCETCPWTGATTVRYERNPADRTRTIAKCSNNSAHPVRTFDYGAEVQNVALIQHSGDMHMVVKEYVSGIDYKGVSVGAPSGVVRVQPGTANEADRAVVPPLGGVDNPGNMAVQNDERLGGSIFTVDGVTIGLEVCLDRSRASRNSGGRRHWRKRFRSC